MIRYASKAKDTFGRGWAVNRIIERLQVPLCDALFLVLAGEDRDRQKLLSRGVLNHNIISVDRDRKCVQSVRRAGGIALQGKIEEVLLGWPVHTPIDALMLDFNCGLNEHAWSLIDGLSVEAVSMHAPIYVNFMRGRDGLGSIAGVKQIRKERSDTILSMETGKTYPTPADYEPRALNRAVVFIWVYCQFSDHHVYYGGIQEGIDPRICAPVYAKPYRQRDDGVMMDGAVFHKVLGNKMRADEVNALAPPIIRRRIAAVLATRTMHKRAAHV